MTKKKEIGSKKKKRILSNIYVPDLQENEILENIQFISEDQEKVQGIIFNKQYAPRFFKYENLYYPTLHLLRKKPVGFASVQVDQGAVVHVLNGADIFTQGITSVDREFEKDSMVIIINPQNSVICIGKSLMSSEDLLNVKGKGILNIHFLGDDIWEGKI